MGVFLPQFCVFIFNFAYESQIHRPVEWYTLAERKDSLSGSCLATGASHYHLIPVFFFFCGSLTRRIELTWEKYRSQASPHLLNWLF